MSGTAISCTGVWKSYRYYHQRSHTLKEKILSRRNRYEEFWALKGVDLDVPVGSTLGIIGANGSGKSTLLKTMARILTPDQGRVEVNGLISSLLELGIGFHPELTGRENVFLSGSLLGQTKREVETNYDEVVSFAGIEDFMDMPIKNYSSGMYARLAFAAAVSVEPEILLVDEVLSVGDESFQLKCYERIAKFRREGRTIVLVSHSLDTIRSLCAEAVWIDSGAVRERGEAHDVVASYLGEIHGSPEDVKEPDASFPSHRFGSGDVVITEVSMLDKDGTRTASFRTGDDMTIRVTYGTRVPGCRIVCSISVYRAANLARVVGRDTRDTGIDHESIEEGAISFTVRDLPLLKGEYLVSLAIHDETFKKIYDWHDRRYSFLVFENPDLPLEGGIVHVDASWHLSKAGTPDAPAPSRRVT